MNIKKAMHSLTKTARKVRKVRLEGHKRVIRKKRANVKRRAGKLSEGARKARAVRARLAAAHKLALTKYRAALAKAKAAKTAAVNAAKSVRAPLLATEGPAADYAAIPESVCSDHSPAAASEADSLLEGVESLFDELISTLEESIRATAANE